MNDLNKLEVTIGVQDNPDTIKMALGRAFGLFMAQENISEVDLASKFKCSRQWVSSIVTGGTFSFKTIIRFAKALGLKITIVIEKEG